MKHIRPSAPRTADVWVGARVVHRQFDKNWFLDTVVGINTDEGHTLYQVDYDDCDQEELDVGQLWDAVVYHPRMDDIRERPTIIMSGVGQFVLFALEQLPRIGRVTALDPEAIKCITVHLWKSNKKCVKHASSQAIRTMDQTSCSSTIHKSNSRPWN